MLLNFPDDADVNALGRGFDQKSVVNVWEVSLRELDIERGADDLSDLALNLLAGWCDHGNPGILKYRELS